MNEIRSVVVCTVFILLLPYVFSIKCWICRSSTDPKCADPFDNSTIPITDCERERKLANIPGVSMCRKIKQKVDGEWRHIRDCAYLTEVDIQDDESICLTGTGTDKILTEHCTCRRKDGCNSSNSNFPLPAMLLATVTLPLWLKKGLL